MTVTNNPDYLGAMMEVPKLKVPDEVTATFMRLDPETKTLVKATETRETLWGSFGLHAILDLEGGQPAKPGRKAADDPVALAVSEAKAFAYAARRVLELTLEVQSGASGSQQVSAKGACAAFVAAFCEVGTLLAIDVVDPSAEVPEATAIEILRGPRAGWTSRELELAEEAELGKAALEFEKAGLADESAEEPADGGDGEEEGEGDGDGQV